MRPFCFLASSVFLLAVAATPALAQHCHLETLRPVPQEWGDGFGRSIAVAGDLAVVGAPGKDDGGAQNTGGAYVLRHGAGGWTEEAYLAPTGLPPHAGAGLRVATDGATVVLGSAAGLVLVYERFSGVWTSTGELSIRDASGWGPTLAVDGGVIVVGTPYAHEHGPSTGSAYAFERDAGGWSEVAELLPADVESHLRIGWAVDVQGDLIAVGAPWDDDLGTSSGAVYLWRRGATGWAEEAKLHPLGAGVQGWASFGAALDLDGDGLVVGAPEADIGCGSLFCDFGAAWIFREVGGQWLHESILTSPDVQLDERLGSEVAMDGPRVVLGVDVFGGGRNAVYLFERGAAWTQTARLRPLDDLAQDRYGDAFDIDAGRLLVGDWYAGSASVQEGRVHSYELGLPELFETYCYCYFGAPCDNFDPEGGCANATGSGARLSACGTPSATADSFAFLVEGVEPGRHGLFFMGGAQTMLPFGNGILCVGPGGAGLFRFPVQQASAGGVMTLDAGIAAHAQASFGQGGQIVAGSTFHFQVWYRDPLGPCAAAPNLSNAIRATFTR